MGKWREVPVDELTCQCNPEQLGFRSTEQIKPLDSIIGQERAVKAMEFGLRIKSPGYNIFMSGTTGTGKNTYAQALVQQRAETEDVPDDWCYVYNFDRLGQPLALNLPPGMGSIFVQDVENLIEELLVEIPKAFDGEDYERQKANILNEYQQENNDIVDELNDFAHALGFVLKKTSSGFVSVPAKDGKPMKSEDFDNLDERQVDDLEDKANQLQAKTLEIMRRVRLNEKSMKEKVKELEYQIGLFAVGHLISELQEKYRNFVEVQRYLSSVQMDVLEHLDSFRVSEEEAEQTPIILNGSKSKDAVLRKYRVNLVVDNSKLQGAPVVVEVNPTYYNLLGRVEYKNELGVMSTDFTRIKAGALHRANGGYLILQAKDVLTNVQAWDALKRVLKTGEVRIENLGDQLGAVAVASLKPEGIPCQVKVILIGNAALYQLLYHHDEDFKKLFKVKADFDSEMVLSPDNLTKMASFISSICNQSGLKHFDHTGVAKVVEYSSRLADDQQKLTTRFNEIVEILYEANAWAEVEEAGVVTAKEVEKAIGEKRLRSNKYELKFLEMIEKGKLLVQTKGAVVGQVNGLSILDFGDVHFGKPTRITAATYVGQRGVINIEREVNLSGTSHSKGVLILSGYLGARYAQEFPLTLSASLCFEQLYEGVDGDSASSTELYAILSSLAELPINQGIAVTGSVNQRGEIQPVGGVSSKIEGFYQVCKAQGLTGNQGVIIPQQNVGNLVLSAEVVNAVRDGLFHIYPVQTIDEGITILTGVEAGQPDGLGNYPEGTVNYLVHCKLRKYVKALGTLGRDKSRGERTRRRR